jgi:hypothetical protein
VEKIAARGVWGHVRLGELVACYTVRMPSAFLISAIRLSMILLSLDRISTLARTSGGKCEKSPGLGFTAGNGALGFVEELSEAATKKTVHERDHFATVSPSGSGRSAGKGNVGFTSQWRGFRDAPRQPPSKPKKEW